MILFFTFQSHAGRAAFAWDLSPSPEVTHYALQFCQDSNFNAQTFRVTLGNTNFATVRDTNLVAGLWYVRATAATAEGIESEPSNVVSFNVPQPLILKIQSTTNLLAPWQEFYRLEIER